MMALTMRSGKTSRLSQRPIRIKINKITKTVRLVEASQGSEVVAGDGAVCEASAAVAALDF